MRFVNLYIQGCISLEISGHENRRMTYARLSCDFASQLHGWLVPGWRRPIAMSEQHLMHELPVLGTSPAKPDDVTDIELLNELRLLQQTGPTGDFDQLSVCHRTRRLFVTPV